MGNCFRHFYRRSNSSEDARRPSPTHPPAWYLENDPILHPAPGLSVPFSQLTEDQQVTIAMRMALIATLPIFIYDDNENAKLPECVICMCEYEAGDEMRKMPMCSHIFHRACIDDWLTRSLTCPSCLQEVPMPSSTIPTTPTAVAASTTTASTTATAAVASTTAGHIATASTGRASGGDRSHLSGPSTTDLREEARRIKKRSKEHVSPYIPSQEQQMSRSREERELRRFQIPTLSSSSSSSSPGP
ncbi:RING finger protein [Echinococcus granulosus]|uniref:RING finger protein n=1 Tax=Echinococcus granulosus TaxID=6210 RepID=W6UCL3_ECHGR|nr:RING finger protein [Echinococcus granulosus]EUB56012.1 RING finger protein [Echinococcus granulosus]